MSEFMPMTLQAKGKTIDEAIFNGLNEIGLSIDEVNIEVLQEATGGFMGIGAKPFIVKLTQRSEEYVLEQEETEKQSTQQKARQTLHNEPVAVSEPKAESRPAQDRDNNRPARREKVRDTRPMVQDTTVYSPYVPGESECAGAEFLCGMLKRMGVACGIGFAQSEDFVKFRIDSDSMGILIGHRGETLDALQYLTGLVVNRGKENYRRVTLDTENYRSKREETLIRLARKLAIQVKSTGHAVTLEPMNPYERRVLHATLQNNPSVETHSEGEEPNRCVVVTPRK